MSRRIGRRVGRGWRRCRGVVAEFEMAQSKRLIIGWVDRSMKSRVTHGSRIVNVDVRVRASLHDNRGYAEIGGPVECASGYRQLNRPKPRHGVCARYDGLDLKAEFIPLSGAAGITRYEYRLDMLRLRATEHSRTKHNRTRNHRQ